MQPWMYLDFLIVVLIFPASSLSQKVYNDTVFSDIIASVKFTVSGLPVSLPIADLNRGGKIRLSFDDFEAGYKYYRYNSGIHFSSVKYLSGFIWKCPKASQPNYSV